MNEFVNSEHGSEYLDKGRVLNMAMTAGHILLQNGAEISRVEDTMNRLAKAFQVEDANFFVLSNGIFTTGNTENEKNYKGFAKVKHIPVGGAKLDRVIAVNTLSRQVTSGMHDLDKIEKRLEEIASMPPKPAWAQVLASAVGSACFCIIFGGSLWDSCAALVAGFLLWIFMLLIGKVNMSKLLTNLLGGMLVTFVALFLFLNGIGDDMSHIVIGSIIPLVPGVAFLNGILDLTEGDYISGSVRLLDAILVFLCIAIGVGISFYIYNGLGGSLRW